MPSSIRLNRFRLEIDCWLDVGAQRVPLLLVRNRRARHYILRPQQDGSARVTIPRGGSIAEAMRFANRHLAWLEKQLQRLPSTRLEPEPWTVGSEILFRGEPARIALEENGNGTVRIGSELLHGLALNGDLRPAVECHLRILAGKELPDRVCELAAHHNLTVRRVTVRNQRSRWGSCSRRGTISLNWRLIQAPEFVRDYIILHELMHLRQMNHSERFWQEVEAVCPNYREAERWLKQHAQWFRR